jgi:hypothetical protein
VQMAGLPVNAASPRGCLCPTGCDEENFLHSTAAPILVLAGGYLPISTERAEHSGLYGQKGHHRWEELRGRGQNLGG